MKQADVKNKQKKKNDKTAEKTALNKKKLIITAALCVILAAVVIIVILCPKGKSQPASATRDEPVTIQRTPGVTVSPELFAGSWVTYTNGLRVEYTYDDAGSATFSDANGNESVYHYEIDGDLIILTREEKRQVYLWSPEAVRLIPDHAYGEMMQIIYDTGLEIDDLAGCMYVDGDFLYVGKLTMCREEKLDPEEDASLEGSWIGAAGDRITFNADGTYDYREEGNDYHGRFKLDDTGEQLTITLSGESTVYTHDDWHIHGNMLHIQKRYYFKIQE